MIMQLKEVLMNQSSLERCVYFTFAVFLSEGNREIVHNDRAIFCDT